MISFKEYWGRTLQVVTLKLKNGDQLESTFFYDTGDFYKAELWLANGVCIEVERGGWVTLSCKKPASAPEWSSLKDGWMSRSWEMEFVHPLAREILKEAEE